VWGVGAASGGSDCLGQLARQAMAVAIATLSF
jgi:hypothetical protein